MTRRRWIADTVSPLTGRPTHAALTGEQATHLARVLRAEPHTARNESDGWRSIEMRDGVLQQRL